MRVLHIVGAIAAVAALAGCASTANWQHPSRAGDGHDDATIALAECESYAAGRTPPPQMQEYTPVPAPTTYSTRGTYNNYGSYGTYQGTTTASGGFASNFAAGANMGADIANAYAIAAARSRQDKLAAACMRKLGWIDTSTPEGQAKFQEITAAKLAEKAAPKKSEAEKEAEERWHRTIAFFLDAAATTQGGIDYRKDPSKMKALDKYVRELANDPKNQNQSMAWFLVEAHKKVLAEQPPQN